MMLGPVKCKFGITMKQIQIKEVVDYTSVNKVFKSSQESVWKFGFFHFSNSTCVKLHNLLGTGYRILRVI